MPVSSTSPISGTSESNRVVESSKDRRAAKKARHEALGMTVTDNKLSGHRETDQSTTSATLEAAKDRDYGSEQEKMAKESVKRRGKGLKRK